MDRLNVQKTYKIFIGGKFPRTESGRIYQIQDHDGDLIANMCLSSKKDHRNAVVAARKAQNSWSSKTAFNRSQILYRLAEMLETRRAAFINEMLVLKKTKKQAETEVDRAIDCLVYYAGWCDKYISLFSSVNPTASNHFNFSVHEPTGVVSAIAPEDSPLFGIVSVIAPVIAGGNTIIVLASESNATSAISFCEVIQNSDVPAGVVNVLTGKMSEIAPYMANHMDVNAFVVARDGLKDGVKMSITENLKRYSDWSHKWQEKSPYLILDLQEVKTTWHPVQTSAASGSGY